MAIKMATVVLDNGAGLAKVGYSTDKSPRLMPNCITKAKSVRTRTFIGDQIDDCKDLSGLFYLLPFQKGYLVNWETQRQIWDYMFNKDGLKVDLHDSNIIVTEPYFNFHSVQEAMDEIFFEEYQFNSVFRCNSSFLSQYKHCKEKDQTPLCSIVLDAGYSFTHIIPYCKGKKLAECTKRIDVGGKVMTNHLKEVISYRQLMVMDETYVLNQLKEDVCYVSQDFMKDMEIGRKKGKENTIARDYVLPDYTHIKRGYVKPLEETTGRAKDGEQIIRMNNERFTIPELLFHPSDVGIHEMGVAEAVVHTIQSLPEEMQPHMYNNVILTGGNCKMPGFYSRMERETRSMTPDEYDLCMKKPENPSTYAWEGGTLLAKDPQIKKMSVTREEYEENGHNICFEKFDV
ncbi:actin-related protein 6-like [Mytilus trossulus]|uniref:actin-related protein 6-like n=1 Tax=Mytilus trossulus TaxID=6551 RepID=UPI003007C5DB